MPIVYVKEKGIKMIINYSFSIPGPYHINKNIPCQDACYARKKNGIAFAAAADGLGSMKFSDIGSSIAAKTAVDYCLKKYRTDISLENKKKLMFNAFIYAFRKVVDRAKDDGNLVDEYSSTLVLAILDNTTLYCCNSGDSGVFARLVNGEYIQVTHQQRDKSGGVYPLCSGPDVWEFKVIENVASAVLFTDGVFDIVKADNKSLINTKLLSKLMDYYSCDVKQLYEIAKDNKEFMLNFPPIILNDDKTVVTLINTDFNPEDTTAIISVEQFDSINEREESKDENTNFSSNTEEGIRLHEEKEPVRDTVDHTELEQKNEIAVIEIATSKYKKNHYFRHFINDCSEICCLIVKEVLKLVLGLTIELCRLIYKPFVYLHSCTSAKEK